MFRFSITQHQQGMPGNLNKDKCWLRKDPCKVLTLNGPLSDVSLIRHISPDDLKMAVRKKQKRYFKGNNTDVI